MLLDLIIKLWMPCFCIASLIISLVVKLNDTKHLEKEIKKINDRLDGIEKEVKRQGEEIAFVQGKLNGK